MKDNFNRDYEREGRILIEETDLTEDELEEMFAYTEAESDVLNSLSDSINEFYESIMY